MRNAASLMLVLALVATVPALVQAGDASQVPASAVGKVDQVPLETAPPVEEAEPAASDALRSVDRPAMEPQAHPITCSDDCGRQCGPRGGYLPHGSSICICC